MATTSSRKGLTDAAVSQREKFAFGQFKRKPDMTAVAMLKWLKKHHKFGMRMGRLYELKKLATQPDSEYMPKSRKKRGENGATERGQDTTLSAPQQAARTGVKVPEAYASHPALAEARRLLEAAGFLNVRIDALAPIHYEEPHATA